MIIKPVLTEVVPMRMGIYWALPWPDVANAREQAYREEVRKSEYFGRSLPRMSASKRKAAVSKVALLDPEEPYISCVFGLQHNWAGAMRISIEGEDVRVFPDEVSKLTPENMRLYVMGSEQGEPTHELVPGTAAETQLVEEVLKGNRRLVYDAALVDGCTEAEAVQVALGNRIELPDAEFAPVGWYRPKWPILEMVCQEPELARIEKKYGRW